MTHRKLTKRDWMALYAPLDDIRLDLAAGEEDDPTAEDLAHIERLADERWREAMESANSGTEQLNQRNTR